jgi:hypothetical protein
MDGGEGEYHSSRRLKMLITMCGLMAETCNIFAAFCLRVFSSN